MTEFDNTGFNKVFEADQAIGAASSLQRIVAWILIFVFLITPFLTILSPFSIYDDVCQCFCSTNFHAFVNDVTSFVFR